MICGYFVSLELSFVKFEGFVLIENRILWDDQEMDDFVIFCLCKMFLSPFFAGVCFTWCLEFFGEKNVVILFRFVFVIEYSLISFSFLLCLFSIRWKWLCGCVVDAFEDGLSGECVVEMSFSNWWMDHLGMIVEGGVEVWVYFWALEKFIFFLLLCFCWFGWTNKLFILVDCEAFFGVCCYRGDAFIVGEMIHFWTFCEGTKFSTNFFCTVLFVEIFCLCFEVGSFTTVA